MAVTNFISEVWSKKLQKIFDTHAVFRNIVNTNFEGDIKDAGDKVKIRTYGDITINDYTRGATLSFQTLTDPMDTLNIDQQKYFSFLVDDLDKVQSNIDLLTGYSERAAIAIRNVIDKALHAQAYGGIKSANVIGTSGSPINLSKDNIFQYVAQMSELMDASNTPGEDRHLVIAPWVKTRLLRSPEFIRSSEMGDKTVMNGYIGEYLGFRVHVSTNLNTVSGATPIVALTRDLVTFASQVAKVEAVDPPDMFAKGIKGLYLYGSKVVQKSNGCGAVLWAVAA